jgi:hypothetical protein
VLFFKTISKPIILIYIFLLIHLPVASFAETDQNKSKSDIESHKLLRGKNKIDITYYFDSRDYNTLNILTLFPDLPLDLKIFGFVDFHGEQNQSDNRFDLTRYFMEYRLGRPLFPKSSGWIKGLGIEAEYNDFNGQRNHVSRFGATYKHKLPLLGNSKSWLQWRYHPYETDGSGSQASVIYFISLTEDFFINGFADVNFIEDGRDRWLLEPQLNYKLTDLIDAALEFRYNEFEDANPKLDGVGVAVGLKLKF